MGTTSVEKQVVDVDRIFSAYVANYGRKPKVANEKGGKQQRAGASPTDPSQSQRAGTIRSAIAIGDVAGETRDAGLGCEDELEVAVESEADSDTAEQAIWTFWSAGQLS
mgnify:CR=1 FL=1